MRASRTQTVVVLSAALAVASTRVDVAWAERHSGAPPLEPALEKRIADSVQSLRPKPGEPIPGFPALRRGVTKYLDVSTTRDDARLTLLLRLAETTRVALDHYLGAPDADAGAPAPVPVVFCDGAQFLSWVGSLELVEADLRRAQRSLNWCAQGICGARDDVSPEGSTQSIGSEMFPAHVSESDRVIHVMGRVFLDARFPKSSGWVRSGLSYLLCRDLNGTTATGWTAATAYGPGERRAVATKEMWRGGAFHPGYLSRLIDERRVTDLRLVLAASPAALTADDDVLGLYFFDWTVHILDPQHRKVGAWLAAMEAGTDPDAASRRAFGRKESERVLEAVDAEFRRHHRSKHPPPDARLQDERRERLPGTWTATKASVAEYRKKHGQRRDARLEFRADGTVLERLNDGRAQEGRWELEEDRVELVFPTGQPGTGTGRVATWRDRELLYFGLVLRRDR